MIDMVFRYTKHQVARGAIADAESGDTLYLLKNVSELRATYQIRLLAFRAVKEGKRLVIRLPSSARIYPSLRELRKTSRKPSRPTTQRSFGGAGWWCSPRCCGSSKPPSPYPAISAWSPHCGLAFSPSSPSPQQRRQRVCKEEDYKATTE